MFFKSSFLNEVKTDISKRIAKMEYKIGSTWRPCSITARKVEGNSIIITGECQGIPEGNQTINGLRIIDDSGAIAGESTENISKTSTQGIFIKIEIPLVEKEV